MINVYLLVIIKNKNVTMSFLEYCMQHSTWSCACLMNPSSQTVSENKGKALLVHAMKAYVGIAGIAPLVSNLGVGWR